MKLIKILSLAFVLVSVSSYSQDYVLEELPVATIDENYYVTVPVTPIEEYYYIDISHLSFESEEQANNYINAFLYANITRPVLNYEERYVVLQIMLEFIGDDRDPANLQIYLNRLSKPNKY